MAKIKPHIIKDKNHNFNGRQIKNTSHKEIFKVSIEGIGEIQYFSSGEKLYMDWINGDVYGPFEDDLHSLMVMTQVFAKHLLQEHLRNEEIHNIIDNF